MKTLFQRCFNHSKIIRMVTDFFLNARKRPGDSEEWTLLENCRAGLEKLLCEERYIARSEFYAKEKDWQKACGSFHELGRNGLLRDYAGRYHIRPEALEDTLAFFEQLETLRLSHNADFVESSLVKEKDYFDHILDPIDPSICLDEDQRRMVLDDEDYFLAVAGAGAGKTTAIAAKVRYLVERKGVFPEEILVISFTNKAVAELKQHLRKELGIPCPTATFHSTGNAVLHREHPDRENVADASLKYITIMNYFHRHVLRDESMTHLLVLFFSYYLDSPFDEQDTEAFFRNITLKRYETMKSHLGEISYSAVDARSRKPVTIQNELVRSMQEAEIANFLYLNGITYVYEPVYPYDIPGSAKPYTPDFQITQDGKVCYLEHFGLSQDGENNRYTREELQKYRKAVNEKVIWHRVHHTELIYTFSSYKDGRPLREHLREELEKHGFSLNPVSEQAVLEKLLLQKESRIVSRLVMLLTRFIGIFKINDLKLEDFNRLRQKQENVRNILFLDICRACYLEYERVLQERKAVDFEDMINESAEILFRMAHEKEKAFPFRYVIVDEYQDISRQRYDLVKALREATGAKIVAVGDDWQSIYAFSGSDTTLFTKFEENMGYAQLLRIEHTYRNAQELIDIAGGFIQKNTAQLKKSLKSTKNITDPVIILSYEQPESKKTAVFSQIALCVEHALDEIVKYHGGKQDGFSVLVLGRFGFDGYKLSQTEAFAFHKRESRIRSRKYPKIRMTFMTAHASKGLGYDDVIILNAMDDRFGFPAKIEDDPVLNMLIREDRSYEYAEERRLFYVALTRTKNRVWIIAPSDQPSVFVRELIKDNKDMKVEGHFSETSRQRDGVSKYCPVCGYPLRLRFHPSIGLPLYLCTNEPEICGFMTNDLRGGKLQIRKCHSCRDGYLIVKRNGKTGGFFLGCTNYRKEGGCRSTVNCAD